MEIIESGHIYVVWEEQFRVQDLNVYKIGKSKEIFSRISSGYPKGSLLLFTIFCPNIDKAEKDLLTIFKDKYTTYNTPPYENSRERFESDDYISIINDIIYYRSLFKIPNNKKSNVLILPKDKEEKNIICFSNELKKQEKKEKKEEHEKIKQQEEEKKKKKEDDEKIKKEEKEKMRKLLEKTKIKKIVEETLLKHYHRKRIIYEFILIYIKKNEKSRIHLDNARMYRKLIMLFEVRAREYYDTHQLYQSTKKEFIKDFKNLQRILMENILIKFCPHLQGVDIENYKWKLMCIDFITLYDYCDSDNDDVENVIL